MSFEQLKNNEHEENKRKKVEEEKTQDFFLEKKLQNETSNLLQKLAQDISQKFGIDISQVKELISGSTLGNLDSLKSSMNSEKKINFSDLQNAISKAKNNIEELSKKKIESLKNKLSKKEYSPDTYKYHTSQKLFGFKTLKKAKSPQNFGDQVIGLGLGLIDSTEAVILFTYGLGKGILLTPYHLYLLITGRADYDGFSKI